MSVFHSRLLRDGWTRQAYGESEDVLTWERYRPGSVSDGAALRFSEVGWDPTAVGGPQLVEYAVRWTTRAVLQSLEGVTWADWDQQGRLIVAKEGRLMWLLPDDASHEIADFNEHAPDPKPSPPQARDWPSTRD